MSEKVTLTKEQAEAVEYFRKTFVENKKCSMSNEKLAKALSNGYEVEEEFRNGDWVIAYNKTFRITGTGSDGLISLDDCGGIIHKDHIRHATEQEIAQEKERRFFARHNRGLWELSKNDMLIDKYGNVHGVTRTGEKEIFLDYVSSSMEVVKAKYKVLVFVENRLDL